ncbi:hypothetical protein HDK77DRAFT_40065 [Phyllosticta capitalensis]
MGQVGQAQEEDGSFRMWKARCTAAAPGRSPLLGWSLGLVPLLTTLSTSSRHAHAAGLFFRLKSFLSLHIIQWTTAAPSSRPPFILNTRQTRPPRTPTMQQYARTTAPHPPSPLSLPRVHGSARDPVGDTGSGDHCFFQKPMTFLTALACPSGTIYYYPPTNLVQSPPYLGFTAASHRQPLPLV